MTEHSLDGKIALIIGADSASGDAVAIEMARRGAVVGIQYLTSFEAAKGIVREIERIGGMAVAFKADLDDPAQAELLCVRVRGALGRIDVVVAETGAALGATVPHAGDAAAIRLPGHAAAPALADAVVLLTRAEQLAQPADV